MLKKITYADAVNNRIFKDSISKRIIVMLPAYNEEDSIGRTLSSLVKLNKPKGILLDVFIALDNCTDNTEGVISHFKDELDIFTLDTVNNHEHKVGALNQLYQLFLGKDDSASDNLGQQQQQVMSNVVAFLGIDADVYLEKDCLITLYAELNKKYNIAGVSANYVSLLPETKRHLLQDDPQAESKLAHGQYGGPIARFITQQQNRSFAQWTLEQKHNGYVASILGGQCTLFRPEALIEVAQHFKLNGVYSSETDTEDLLLTQQLREIGWHPMISDRARCYVDTMKTMKAYANQQRKWVTGKLDYTTKAGLSTAYARKNWIDEITLWMNMLIRLCLIVLVPLSLSLHMFRWSWVWSIPIVIGVILNLIVILKLPRHRFLDLLLSITLISPEFALWFDAYVHLKSWQELAKVERDDGWTQQYLAEQGKLKQTPYGFYIFLGLLGCIGVGIGTRLLSLNSLVSTIHPYINDGFTLLTYLTIIATMLMLHQLLKIRGPFKV